MKHTTPNPDGSFTTYDETEDGFFLTMASKIFDKVVYNKEKKAEEQYIIDNPYYCTVCGDRFKTEKSCLNHINGHFDKPKKVGKNGRKH